MGAKKDGLGTELGFAIVALSVILYLTYRLRKRRFFHLANKIPGPTGYPVIGNLLDFTGGPNDIMQKVLKRTLPFQNIYKVWIGPRLLVFLDHPADVELILSSHVHIDKATEYKFFEPWLGDGLLISTGEKWRSHRKLIAPTFHLNVLKSFFDTFNKNSKAVVERLSDKAGTQIDCHDYMSEATVEMLLETVMGVNKTNTENAFDYAMAVMKMCEILHLRQSRPWLRSEAIFNMTTYGGIQKNLLSTIHKLTRKVLRIRKTAFDMDEGSMDYDSGVPGLQSKQEVTSQAQDNKSFSFGQAAGLKDDLDVNDDDIGMKKRVAFLDLLIQTSRSLKHGTYLSDEEIQNQVDTIMFEGHDTTAAASSFFLCMMAAHPDIQDKVIAEIDSIFEGSDRDVTFQDTLEMKYLERCIMETLRMYPPVPIIARQLKSELRLSSMDVVIPKECTVVVATYKLHRRADIYPDPTTFNPDNFLPEKAANRHYYAFIPFSAGPRSCVGRKYAMLKLKVLLATIMRNFRVVGGPAEKDWLLQADIILKRSDGFNITVQPRIKPTSS